ncbi:MAG: hypothetical protein R3185_06700, partial [Candidatus Thermoplasmatota archaeon]|nr:hypothetical protein [Candidatus Thermoplasmatota archaeon]
MSSKLSSKPWNPETDEETEAPAPPRAPGDEGEPAPRLLRQSRLSPEERLDLETSSFQPGAVYEEVSWTKTAREGLGDIQAKIDRMRGVEGRPERKRPAPKSRTGRLPTGLRSRIREALGSIAHVRLVYATKEHHICRVGLRDGVDVEEVIVVVGPDDVRQVESVLEAVDQLPAGETPSAETTS